VFTKTNLVFSPRIATRYTCGSFDAIHSIHFLCNVPSEEMGGDPFLARSSLMQYTKSDSDKRATLDFMPMLRGPPHLQLFPYFVYEADIRHLAVKTLNDFDLTISVI